MECHKNYGSLLFSWTSLVSKDFVFKFLTFPNGFNGLNDEFLIDPAQIGDQFLALDVTVDVAIC